MAAVAITDVVKLYICKPCRACRACGKKPDIHLDDGESGPWVSFDDPSVEWKTIFSGQCVARTFHTTT